MRQANASNDWRRRHRHGRNSVPPVACLCRRRHVARTGARRAILRKKALEDALWKFGRRQLFLVRVPARLGEVNGEAALSLLWRRHTSGRSGHVCHTSACGTHAARQRVGAAGRKAAASLQSVVNACRARRLSCGVVGEATHEPIEPTKVVRLQAFEAKRESSVSIYFMNGPTADVICIVQRNRARVRRSRMHTTAPFVNCQPSVPSQP